jgi:RNA-directed DNA polymerase
MLKDSFDNFLLAWKRITTSTGAKTAGVDKKKWKNKSFSHFIEADRLFEEFREQKGTKYSVKPLRRKNIPKPDGSLRPLGIPTISDRLLQAIYTPAIEAINEYIKLRKVPFATSLWFGTDSVAIWSSLTKMI